MKGAGSLDPAPGTQAPCSKIGRVSADFWHPAGPLVLRDSEPRPVERPGGFQAVLSEVVASSERAGGFQAVLLWPVLFWSNPGVFEVSPAVSGRLI